MSTGHLLPPEMSEPGSDGDGEAPGRPPAPRVPEPTHAERARTLVAGASRGVLSTVSVEPAGYPYGSVATYALDDLGRPIVFVSTMAAHTHNALADARASLFVSEPVPEGADPLAFGRVTLIGDLLTAPAEEVRDTYLAANPTSAYYIDFGDFSFFRLEVRAIRYVGGYGRMSWVDPSPYAAAEADPLAPLAAGIVEHMNDDHAEAMVLMARHLAGRPDTESVTMSGVDRYGFDLVVSTPTGREALRLGLEGEPATGDEVRRELVRLTRQARELAAQSG